MTTGSWILLIELVGTILWIGLRVIFHEKWTWRYLFTFTWPITLAVLIIGALTWLVGKIIFRDPRWDDPNGGAEPPTCEVCGGKALLSFDDLTRRAELAEQGKSEDVMDDLKLFAPIVKDFVRKHRWEDAKKEDGAP